MIVSSSVSPSEMQPGRAGNKPYTRLHRMMDANGAAVESTAEEQHAPVEGSLQ